MSPSELPVSRRSGRRVGFTLVELLVVIGIIAVLVSILLPALQRARDSAATIKCASNVRSMVQGLLAYSAENKQYLPGSYGYLGTYITPGVTGQAGQNPADNFYGYVHWSGLLFGNIPPESFQCPVLTNGGLAATNPPVNGGGFDSGQTSGNTGSPIPSSLIGRVTTITAVDGTGALSTYNPDNYGRMSYTANEALMCRNKFVVGFQNAFRTYHNVQLTQIDNQSGTILITEFVDDSAIVSGTDPTSGGVAVKSHRPVSAWRAEGTAAGDHDKTSSSDNYVDPSAIMTTTKLRHTVATDLWNLQSGSVGGVPSLDIVSDAQKGIYITFASSTAPSRATRLDWVGRNHGYGAKPADKKTNFAYVDGHVETKSILETMAPAINADGTVPATPWEWGSKAFTISPNNLSASQNTP